MTSVVGALSCDSPHDIIDACDSIISIDTYVQIREKRSAEEREFIIIGEAFSMLARFWPESFKRLSDGH
jgi:hypothetical protein